MKPGLTQYSFEHISEASREEIDRILKREKIFHETREDLYCNNRYDRFFSHFNDESVRDFIDAYAIRKANYLIYGDQHLHETEKSQLHFRQVAGRIFWEIQQKKLFDCQCLWRAARVVLDGIDVTRDFYLEEFSIGECRLISPVTNEELNIYIDYLNSEAYQPESHHARWQDYDFIRSGWQSVQSTVPAWYAFYDEAIGSGELLALPDVKGEKEAHYLRFAGRENASLQRERGVREGKPELKTDYKTLEFFITTFEDKSLIRYFDAVEKDHPDISDAGRVEEALRILRLSDEPVPLPASADWKAALIETAMAFSKKQLTHALRSMFDEYRLRIKAGLSFASEADPVFLDLLKGKISRYKESILQGRHRLNEPEDFTY